VHAWSPEQGATHTALAFLQKLYRGQLSDLGRVAARFAEARSISRAARHWFSGREREKRRVVWTTTLTSERLCLLVFYIRPKNALAATKSFRARTSLRQLFRNITAQLSGEHGPEAKGGARMS
jgi:hypothetical protein